MTFISDSGKLYCYGIFDGTKIKRQKYYSEPKRISEHFVARIAKCGSTFVVFVTGNENKLIRKTPTPTITIIK